MIIDNIKTKVIAVNVKVDKTSCAIVDVRGNLLSTNSFSTSEYQNVSDFVTVLCNHISMLLEESGDIESVRSVGMSIPSGNFQTGCIENAPNMPWKGVVPMAAMVRDRLGIAVALGNNAYVTALAEQAFGAAHGMQDFIVISLGSGLGSCFFSRGAVYRGANGFAGEIGHACVEHNGRECGCGKLGCLEAYTATKGIIRTARELMEESDTPSMMRQTENLTPNIIADFCHMGDELAIETYRRAGYMLGIGVANYCSVLNPEAVIFTGFIEKAGKWMLEPAYQAFEEHVFHNIKGKVDFILSGMNDEIRELLGASVLAWRVKEYSLFK